MFKVQGLTRKYPSQKEKDLVKRLEIERENKNIYYKLRNAFSLN